MNLDLDFSAEQAQWDILTEGAPVYTGLRDAMSYYDGTNEAAVMMAARPYLQALNVEEEVSMEALSNIIIRVKGLLDDALGAVKKLSDVRRSNFTGWFKLFRTTTERLRDKIEESDLTTMSVDMGVKYAPMLVTDGRYADLYSELSKLINYFDRVMNADLADETRAIIGIFKPAQKADLDRLHDAWAELIMRNLEINQVANDEMDGHIPSPNSVLRTQKFIGSFALYVAAKPFMDGRQQKGWSYVSEVKAPRTVVPESTAVPAYPKEALLQLIDLVGTKLKGWIDTIEESWKAEKMVYAAYYDLYGKEILLADNDDSAERLLESFGASKGGELMRTWIDKRIMVCKHLYAVSQAVIEFGNRHIIKAED